MTKFEIDDRVRAKGGVSSIGRPYWGLSGTVTGVASEVRTDAPYTVEWDFPPEGLGNGGRWTEESLERIYEADDVCDEEEVTADLEEKIEKLERRLRQANRRTEAAQHLYREQEERNASERQHLYLEINEHHAALEYVFTHLPEADQHRLAGFRDGYAARTNEDDVVANALDSILQSTR